MPGFALRWFGQLGCLVNPDVQFMGNPEVAAAQDCSVTLLQSAALAPILQGEGYRQCRAAHLNFEAGSEGSPGSL